MTELSPQAVNVTGLTHKQFVELQAAINMDGDGWHVEADVLDGATASVDKLHREQYGVGFADCKPCASLRDALYKMLQERWANF